MSVDALIARMTLEAQTRIAAARARSDAEVAALAESGARASSRDLEQELAARDDERSRAFAIERAETQRRAAAAVLNAQHAFLDRVFARAEALAAQAQAQADRRYLDTLPGEIAAVARYMGGRAARLRCRGDLAECLRRLLADAPQFELCFDDQVAAGFIALAGDGSCTIDATLGAQLRALRPQLEATLLAQTPK
jgi:vacuolar-type H+-ATPase subunit E/Vma4